jgi:isoleucyl-tRNA synthetase
VLLTYWNSVSFQALYARAAGWTPTGEPPAVAGRHVLDRWLVSETHTLVGRVTEALEAYDTQRAGALVSDFVDGLSNWYVRRSRRRFWDGQPSALWTLHETLRTLTCLMAPLAPFITERVWSDLFVAAGDEVDSVHRASWPVADPALVDDALAASMALTRRVVELGRAARAEAKVKIRQPLSRVLVPSAADARLTEELRAEVAAELNVQRVESFAGAGDLVDHSAKGNFRALGRRFGQQTPDVARAVAAADADALAAALADGGTATVEVPGLGAVDLVAEEVLLTERPREGWSVVNEHGETVALDLHLTPELVRAGLAREVVRLVQEARKDSGFDVSDRITLRGSAGGDLAEALREHSALVAGEVLAVEVDQTDAPDGDGWRRDEELGLAFAVRRV